ncbi:MAG: carbohydrate kinase family protein [Patescibacteria group bacterium]|nr:carbohydrate kinase family protein [Patescibacteria group bacterium]
MDFLTVGDTVIDAFIRLHEARVHCNIKDEDCEICMRWGDKIPFEFTEVIPAVGNAANAAVAAARLGLPSGLRAYVGDDEYGTQVLKSLQKDGVDTSLVERQAGKKTNYHYVLWYEDQRTILIKHESYDYTLPHLGTPPKWAYLSSLSENSLSYHEAWANYLEANPGIKLAFQPGTFQLSMGAQKLGALYKRSTIFFCNKEEAERILQKPAGADMKELLTSVRALGPKIVVITDDKRGCYSIDEAGAMLHCPRYPDPRAPYEITGAGDALASTTTAALMLGKPLSDALQWGSVNASSVLQSVGAQKGLLAREELEKNLAHPPAPWEVTVLN